MAYDYIVNVKANTDDITSDILKAIEKADGSKIRIKCDDKDIKRVLGKLSKIDDKFANQIEIDVNGDDVTKTLTQIRNEAHQRIEEIKKELNTIDIDSVNSKLSQKKKELEDTKNKAYKKELESLAKGINAFPDLGSDTSSKSYKNNAQRLLDYVETYKSAGGEMSEIDDKIKNVIQNIDSSISGTAGHIEISKSFQKEIQEIENEIQKLQVQVTEYNKLKQELTEYEPFLEGSGSGGSGFSINDEDLKELKGLLESIEQSLKSVSKAFGAIDDNASFQSLLSSINGINTALDGMRAVFVDVGDGQEFSPLIGALKEIKEAVDAIDSITTNQKSKETAKPKKDKNAKRNKISDEDFLDNSTHYASIANEKLKKSGSTILGETVSTELVDGLVKVTAKIKAADDTWRTFSAKIDADGNMFDQRFRTITKGVDKLESELENFGRESSPDLTYQQTLDSAKKIKEELNLSDDFSIKVDSSGFVTITKKLADVDKAGASVTQTFKSAEDAIENFGKEASNSAEKTSIALKSVSEKKTQDNKDKQNTKRTSESKEEVLSVKKAYEILKDTKQEYLDLDSKIKAGNATDKEIARLKELELAQKTIINDTSDAMSRLKFSDTGEVFENVFTKAEQKVKELNNQLKSGEISIDEYTEKIKQIQKSIKGTKTTKTVDFIDVENIEQAKDAMNAYANELSEGVAIQKTMSASGDSITYSWKDQENAVHSLTVSYNELTGAMSASHKISGVDAINNAINKTAEAMKKLQYTGSGESFDNMFAQASQRVAQLNEELRSGAIPLEAYEQAIQKIKDSLKDGTLIKIIDKDDVNDIKSAKVAMEQYALEVSDGRAKLNETKSTVDSLTFEWKDQNGAVQTLTMTYNDLTRAITGAVKPLSNVSHETKNFADRIKQGWINVGQYVSSFMGFYEIINAIGKGINVIRELDTALTEMRKVSDESLNSLKKFQDVSFDMAGAIGTTAAQIQNSTADFMRIGYNLDISSELAEDANIYANVGDMEIDEATEHMISSIQAWKSEFSNEVEASEAIIDRYNEIGNNFAISSADIGSAMEKSAAALKAGGNTLNESLGLITAGKLYLKYIEIYIYRTYLIAGNA